VIIIKLHVVIQCSRWSRP